MRASGTKEARAASSLSIETALVIVWKGEESKIMFLCTLVRLHRVLEEARVGDFRRTREG